MLPEVFKIENNKVVLSPEILLIPQLYQLYEDKVNDTDPTWDIWFANMHFKLWPETPYRNLGEKEREEVIDHDFPIDISDPRYNIVKNWLAYAYTTPSKKIYESVKMIVDRITEYAANLEDITDGKDGNLPQLISLVRNSEPLLRAYKDVEIEYKKEVMEARGTKGIAWDSKESYD